jgi:hypothetical protein
MELKGAFEDYQKKMWIEIGKTIGMSAPGCRARAMEMKLIAKT